MDEPKPFASLSSGLLARKGHAKPAMRPQSYGSFGAGPDDLGWNDMGHDAGDAGQVPPRVPVPPVVHRQQAEIAEEFGRAARNAHADAVDDAEADEDVSEDGMASLDANLVAMPRGEARGKAAFTLRLDAERHLKLRLACALNNRSAQQVVTEALDTFLASIPNLEALAGAVVSGDANVKRGVGR